jgi:hypothetical protein
MRKILILSMLVFACSANAQVKNVAQVIAMSEYSFNKMQSSLNKGYWKDDEKGKMDTLSYARWVPKDMNEKNMGEMVMVYYKHKDKPVDYMVYQTLNKAVFDKAIKDLLSTGYKSMKTENKENEKRTYYAKGKYNISMVQGRQKTEDPWMYIMGVRIIEPVKK